MAAPGSPMRFGHKKKIVVRSSHHHHHHHQDKKNGMNAPTQRHFDHVKQKMFAFLDQQNQAEFRDMQAPMPPPNSSHHNLIPIVVDRSKLLKPHMNAHIPSENFNMFLPNRFPLDKQMPFAPVAKFHIIRRK